MIRQEQCDKVCRVLDDVLANRPTERDSLIIATRKAFEALEGAKWIPCSERLPEEDTEVLISYRYKEGEGDTDNVNIDITSYGTTCFGGREIHTLKEWRQPFDYFHANYEVIAWMPLPPAYHPEDKMDDLISRQAAIDALIELYEYQRDIDPTEAADLVRQGIYLAEKKIEQLPASSLASADPTNRCGCVSTTCVIN